MDTIIFLHNNLVVINNSVCFFADNLYALKRDGHKVGYESDELRYSFKRDRDLIHAVVNDEVFVFDWDAFVDGLNHPFTDAMAKKFKMACLTVTGHHSAPF